MNSIDCMCEINVHEGCQTIPDNMIVEQIDDIHQPLDAVRKCDVIASIINRTTADNMFAFCASNGFNAVLTSA